MPIDTHVRVAAWLHIVLGAIAACAIGLFGLLFGGFGVFAAAAAHGQDGGILAWLASFGIVLFLFLMAFPVLEIVGAVMLLGGSPAGKVITIVFSILGLIGFPVGTIVAVYSLWALLRTPPPSMPGNLVEPTGALRPY